MENAAYSWWVHPLAAQDAQGRTWVGAIDDQGNVSVSIDGNRVQIDTAEPDDHNAPAIALHDTKDAMVFNTRHAKDTFVTYRYVSPDGQTSSDRLLNVERRATYVQALTDGDTIYILTRGSACRWFVFISDDWGKSWTSAREFLNGCEHGKHVYVTTGRHPADDVYRIAAYGHPVQSRWRSIDYGFLDLGTGLVKIPGGKTVANLRTTEGLPIKQGDMQEAYTPRDGQIIRMFDIGTVAGMPTIAFAEWDEYEDGTRGPARHRTVRYSYGGGWQAMDVGRYTGDAFWEPSNYIHGSAIDAEGHLYTGSKQGLERWSYVNGRWESDILLDAYEAVRPYWIRNTANDIMWQTVNEYPDYMKYDIDVNFTRDAYFAQ